MLILTRRVGETLMIGQDVALTVLSTNGRQVRIGITADPKIPIHREEIFQKINRERIGHFDVTVKPIAK